jgi:hypothetical protein
MKLEAITNNDQTIEEWSLMRSKEWKEGYAQGYRGRPLDIVRASKDEDFRRGWISGYKKYVARVRPDLV